MLGEVTFITVVRDERDALMTRIREQLDREADQYGIEVVDVRIRRADLPEQNSQAVYQRMQTERQREAAEFRAQGGQKAQEIRSKADREATVIVAEANSTAEQTRGVATPNATACSLMPMAGIRISSPSTARCRPTRPGSLQRHPLPVAAGFRVLPLLRRSVRPSAGGRGAEAVNVRPEYTRSGEAQCAVAHWGPLRRHKSKRRFNSGGLLSDEVHSVLRLPHRYSPAFRVRRPDVCREPSLDAPGDEERAGDAGQFLRIVGIVSAVVGLVLIWFVRR